MFSKKPFLALLLYLFGMSAFAAPPYTFSSGGTIRASEINANFSYLEALIASSGSVKPSSLLRASANAITGNSPVIIYSVPAGASNPYVIRQFNCSSASAGKCYLLVGTDIYTFEAVSNTNLIIPVAAGESVYVQAVMSNNSTMSSQSSIVLSK